MLNPEQPIGIFDSGVGGLTVARAINQLLPNENIIYFGDTAHTPWGNQSKPSIQYYATRITKALLDRNCKTIVVACNSASAAATNEVASVAKGKALIFNVIDPVVEYLARNYQNCSVGLVGTKQTIQSNTYGQRLSALSSTIDLKSLATPLFAPLIEEGLGSSAYTLDFIKYYFGEPIFKDIAAMVLGCTHYPLIREQVDNFFSQKVEIIDSASTVANEVEKRLYAQDLLNNKTLSRQEFFVTADSQFFLETAGRFFPGNIRLETYPLWEYEAANNPIQLPQT